jgi:hypothetical protein
MTKCEEQYKKALKVRIDRAILFAEDREDIAVLIIARQAIEHPGPFSEALAPFVEDVLTKLHR